MAINGTSRRILIVEDEMLIAMHLEDVLTGLGHAVAAIATRIDRAMVLARDGDIDFAILDINVAGSLSFPVADILRRRAIPFVFASGYGAQGLAGDHRSALVLKKPYELRNLERVMSQALANEPIG
jgi:DNA-binding response OmpR family regulator